MRKIVFILGPTAVGKTNFAILLASKILGELISADSRQVFSGLDIISGKDLPKDAKFISLKFSGQENQSSELFKEIEKKYEIGLYILENNIPIYLLDAVNPTQTFSVYDFLKLSKYFISFVSARNKLPIIVGGTGYYTSTLLNPIHTILIPPNFNLRKALEKLSLNSLQEMLKKENPQKFESMNESDRKNKRRLIRAIEVERYKSEIRISKSPLRSEASETNSNDKNSKHFENSNLENSKIVSSFEFRASSFQILKIGLAAPRDVIKKRIDERVEKRIKNGAFEEAEKLFKDYERLSDNVKTANGYNQLFDYFLHKFSKEEAIEAWRRSEYYIAKKQNTWYKKDLDIHWFDIGNKDFPENAIEYAEKWYNETRI